MDLMFWVWNCDGVAGFFMNPCGLMFCEICMWVGLFLLTP